MPPPPRCIHLRIQRRGGVDDGRQQRPVMTQEVIDEAVDFRQAMARLYKSSPLTVAGSSNRGTKKSSPPTNRQNL